MQSIAAIAFGLIAAVLVLANCAGEAPKPAAPSGQKLVGTSKQRLLACAGQPAVDYEQAGLEYMTYRVKMTVGEGYLQSTPTIPVVGSLAMGGKGNEILCEASIVLKGGVVEALAFRSDPAQDSRTTTAMCTPIVAPCLQP